MFRHLKQIYIPTYTKANPNLIGPVNVAQELLKNTTPIKSAKACESCKVCIIRDHVWLLFPTFSLRIFDFFVAFVFAEARKFFRQFFAKILWSFFNYSLCSKWLTLKLPSIA